VIFGLTEVMHGWSVPLLRSLFIALCPGGSFYLL
jgi:hypothetical protein